MDGLIFRLMRASLWLLFATVALISLAYWLLNLATGFGVWGQSNNAGLVIQAALFAFCPLALLVALKKTPSSFRGSLAIFVIAWFGVATIGVLFGTM